MQQLTYNELRNTYSNENFVMYRNDSTHQWVLKMVKNNIVQGTEQSRYDLALRFNMCLVYPTVLEKPEMLSAIAINAKTKQLATEFLDTSKFPTLYDAFEQLKGTRPVDSLKCDQVTTAIETIRYTVRGNNDVPADFDQLVNAALKGLVEHELRRLIFTSGTGLYPLEQTLLTIINIAMASNTTEVNKNIIQLCIDVVTGNTIIADARLANTLDSFDAIVEKLKDVFGGWDIVDTDIHSLITAQLIAKHVHLLPKEKDVKKPVITNEVLREIAEIHVDDVYKDAGFVLLSETLDVVAPEPGSRNPTQSVKDRVAVMGATIKNIWPDLTADEWETLNDEIGHRLMYILRKHCLSKGSGVKLFDETVFRKVADSTRMLHPAEFDALAGVCKYIAENGGLDTITPEVERVNSYLNVINFSLVKFFLDYGYLRTDVIHSLIIGEIARNADQLRDGLIVGNNPLTAMQNFFGGQYNGNIIQQASYAPQFDYSQLNAQPPAHMTFEVLMSHVKQRIDQFNATEKFQLFKLTSEAAKLTANDFETLSRNELSLSDTLFEGHDTKIMKHVMTEIEKVLVALNNPISSSTAALRIFDALDKLKLQYYPASVCDSRFFEGGNIFVPEKPKGKTFVGMFAGLSDKIAQRRLGGGQSPSDDEVREFTQAILDTSMVGNEVDVTDQYTLGEVYNFDRREPTAAGGEMKPVFDRTLAKVKAEGPNKFLQALKDKQLNAVARNVVHINQQLEEKFSNDLISIAPSGWIFIKVSLLDTDAAVVTEVASLYSNQGWKVTSPSEIGTSKELYLEVRS